MRVGFAEGHSFDELRPDWDGDGPRPLHWAAWYPAVQSATEHPIAEPLWFQNEPVARDAALLPADKSYPLVLLSHGTGGVAAGLGWLGYRLAQLGFVALAVNHHGNTGSEPYRAEGFLCLWERARDLSALLDDGSWRGQLAGNFRTGAHVAGFSAGAYTAMLLMGARVEYSQFEPANPTRSPIRGPREFPGLADKIPQLLEDSIVFRASWERRSADYSDSRFSTALVLAPGRSVRGFSEKTLMAISKAIKIVAGDADEIAPPTECARWLHSRVKGSELHVLSSNVGHYAFLPEPTPKGLSEAPEIFLDSCGVDRRVIHNYVATLATKLFAPVSVIMD